MADLKATALYIAPLNDLIDYQLKSFLEFRDEMAVGADISKYE